MCIDLIVRGVAYTPKILRKHKDWEINKLAGSIARGISAANPVDNVPLNKFLR